MKATFHKTKITGIMTVVPSDYIDIDSELDTIYKGDIKALQRIKKVIGLQKRHVAPKHITASDLGEYAATLLLKGMNIDAKSIDALIMVTQTPDYFLPATACYLHGRLGLPDTCCAFDVNQACAGYLYGLYIAHSILDSANNGGGGATQRVLLICGDTISHYVNPKDSNLAPIIGDGVSATILESCQGDTHRKAFFELGTQGKKFYQLIIPQGASRIPTKEIIQEEKIFQTSETRQLTQLYMDGAEIFNFAVQHEPKAFMDIIEYAGLEKNSFDYYFFHQANKYIVDNITKRLGLDSTKVPNITTNKYGNLSGCSIPATICDTLNTRANPLSKSLNITLAGFGAGLSWSNAIVQLDKDFFCDSVQRFIE